MKFIPKHFLDTRSRSKLIPYKTIYIYNGKSEEARNVFNRKLCQVNHCTATNNMRMINKVDLVLTMKTPLSRPPDSPPEQIWVLYLLESPYHTQSLAYYEDTYNWTATYRHDSDIVTPYDKFVTGKHSPYTPKQFNKIMQ
ncbi:hypothetical protein KUTeg_022761 [Tegillarca granosa]|uniref:Fucosyltransferase N-terminal domain-containing protein n=1 Tax=Tegillarca granosa TaxID=220873 RepID=A0ABQ9DZQ6_TEGGR|nr:hypothetical protein KUTeg_022761 [Tegillarca granosa]